MRIIQNAPGGLQAQTISKPTILIGPGQVNRIIQATAGTGSLSMYNVSGYAAFGSPAFTQLGNVTAGSISVLDYPMNNGCYIIPGPGQIIDVTYSMPAILQ